MARDVVDDAAVAEVMSAGKAKKLARAQGIINAFGYNLTANMLRAWTRLPPVPLLKQDLIGPYLTMQAA